jgi:hypothetical protein
VFQASVKNRQTGRAAIAADGQTRRFSVIIHVK